ncbi:hypothetical protein GCM10022222_42560 [Amycolatopsis ultiminotia]|uniref:DUF4097 domain-containing protein n=1 Tax=Amycolatopsis ultiminotia TaxID=543629 RepID=A0ABP6WNV3_9PSEU
MTDKVERIATHIGQGLVELDLSVDVATVEISASEDYTTARVSLTPAVPGDKEAARLIEAATTESRGDRFTVTVPGSQGAGGATVFRGKGNVVVSSGTVTGEVVGLVLGGVNHGVTIVNGEVISGSGTTVLGTAGGGLHLFATVPAGSRIVLTGTAPNLTTRGQLDRVEAETISGDLSIAAADAVDLQTTSGVVQIGACGDVRADSVSGTVRVRELRGAASVRTTSGRIAVTAYTDSTVTAETVSGDIDLSAPRGVEIDARTRSVSGRTSNRRWPE